MTDSEAALWAEELAAENPPAARRRAPGTSNAPGGEWYSAPAAKRRNRPRNLTLTPEAHAALDALTQRPGGDKASAEASAAIIERAERLGVKAGG